MKFTRNEIMGFLTLFFTIVTAVAAWLVVPGIQPYLVKLFHSASNGGLPGGGNTKSGGFPSRGRDVFDPGSPTSTPFKRVTLTPQLKVDTNHENSSKINKGIAGRLPLHSLKEKNADKISPDSKMNSMKDINDLKFNLISFDYVGTRPVNMDERFRPDVQCKIEITMRNKEYRDLEYLSASAIDTGGVAHVPHYSKFESSTNSYDSNFKLPLLLTLNFGTDYIQGYENLTVKIFDKTHDKEYEHTFKNIGFLR